MKNISKKAVSMLKHEQVEINEIIDEKRRNMAGLVKIFDIFSRKSLVIIAPQIYFKKKVF